MKINHVYAYERTDEMRQCLKSLNLKQSNNLRIGGKQFITELSMGQKVIVSGATESAMNLAPHRLLYEGKVTPPTFIVDGKCLSMAW